MKLALNLPINSVSFGQVSMLILRTIFEREKAGDKNIEWFILPHGNVDFNAYGVTDEFKQWLQVKINKSVETYKRDIPVFKLWHLNGSLESFGHKQTLLSFYELDKPSKIELNIGSNNNLCFSSKYSCDVFNIHGGNATYLPLAFDSFSFFQTGKNYHEDGRIVFNLCGKFEHRKHHQKILRAWIKKYGNNKEYSLQAAVFNPFLNPEQNNDMIKWTLQGGVKPFNVSFYPLMGENSTYNDFLNSGDIILGMSGGEGWGLPEFQSVALGKHAVILDAHSYQSWVDKDKAVLVKPSGKIPVYDNVFFRQGDVFNQGYIFDWNPDDFIAGCELAINRVKSEKLNKAGLSLQQDFSKDKFVDNIIKLTQ